MLKRLGALLGWWSLVWTHDFDEGIRLRIVKVHPFNNNKWGVYGVGHVTFHKMNPDGTFEGRYVKKWAEWEYNKKHINWGK